MVSTGSRVISCKYGNIISLAYGLPLKAREIYIKVLNACGENVKLEALI